MRSVASIVDKFTLITTGSKPVLFLIFLAYCLTLELLPKELGPIISAGVPESRVEDKKSATSSIGGFAVFDTSTYPKV